MTRESVAKVAKWEFSRDIKAFTSFGYRPQAGSLALNLDFLVSETLLLGIIHANTGELHGAEPFSHASPLEKPPR